MISPSRSHEVVVPIVHALIWAVGLAVAIFGAEFYVKDVSVPTVRNLYAAALVYVIFLLEIALTFIDIGIYHEDKSFKSNISLEWGLLAFNVVLTIIIGGLYLKYNNVVLLMMLVVVMSYLKYKIVKISNCIDGFFVAGSTRLSFTPTDLQVK